MASHILYNVFQSHLSVSSAFDFFCCFVGLFSSAFLGPTVSGLTENYVSFQWSTVVSVCNSFLTITDVELNMSSKAVLSAERPTAPELILVSAA